MSKPVLVPRPHHPITIEPAPGRVTVRAGDRTIAQTDAADAHGSQLPTGQYIPLADVDQSLLASSATTSYCPFKGDASYYSIPAGGDRAVDAVWEYQNPFDAVSEIKGHIAFYPDRVDAITIEN
jgi:uncharacterized protein (DUF427 family)